MGFKEGRGNFRFNFAGDMDGGIFGMDENFGDSRYRGGWISGYIWRLNGFCFGFWRFMWMIFYGG